MQVVVTGGTGFVGQAIVQGLIQQGFLVRLLVRNPISGSSAAGVSLPPRMERVTVDFFQPQELTQALRGADALVHLVGIIGEYQQNTFERVHHELTDRMVGAAREAGIARLVHMSALGTRPNARARYHQTKWAAEQRIRTSGLDWTVFRPSIIYGTGDQFTCFFDRIAAFSPVIPAFGGGKGLLQPIGIRQVANAFVRCLGEPASFGQIYDLCGRERLSLHAILRAILDARQRRRWIAPIPFKLGRIQASLLEKVWPLLLRRAPPLSRDQLLMLEEDNIGDGTPADSAFGLVHRPFREAMVEQFGSR